MKLVLVVIPLLTLLFIFNYHEGIRISNEQSSPLRREDDNIVLKNCEKTIIIAYGRLIFSVSPVVLHT